MNVLELSEQEICRRNSLEELRKMGINPYPAAAYPVNAYSTEIKEAFDDQAEPREVLPDELLSGDAENPSGGRGRRDGQTRPV